jgi:hypothetical protein
MRDFRDAKTMARSLRNALKTKTIEITHSESLELIAYAFGYDNWNILAAKIEAAEPQAGAQEATRQPKTLYCSFCGKSQHEVQKLIAGALAYVCDKCVELCVGFIREESSFDKVFTPSTPEQIGDPMSGEELQEVLERGKKGVTRNRRALQIIERWLATRAGEDPVGDELLGLPELAYLKNKSPDELLALQQTAQTELKRYEEGLRIATTILAERGQQTG